MKIFEEILRESTTDLSPLDQLSKLMKVKLPEEALQVVKKNLWEGKTSEEAASELFLKYKGVDPSKTDIPKERSHPFENFTKTRRDYLKDLYAYLDAVDVIEKLSRD
jgi:hypothetical protein